MSEKVEIKFEFTQEDIERIVAPINSAPAGGYSSIQKNKEIYTKALMLFASTLHERMQGTISDISERMEEVLANAPTGDVVGGGNESTGNVGSIANEEDIFNKILDPDNYPLYENGETKTVSAEMVLGTIDRDTGEEVDGTNYLRTAGVINVTSYATITPVSDIGGVTQIRVFFYDSDDDYLGNKSVNKDSTLIISEHAPRASYIKCYMSFGRDVSNLVDSELTLNFTLKAAKAEHKKVYLTEHGYSIYGDYIDDDTMHKVVIYAEGKDDNTYNITEIRAPDSNPEEATLCLMNSGNGKTQFVDFSSMVYDPENPEVVIVCQTRGGKQLPKFAIQFRDSTSGRVSKFTIRPDAIPIELTSAGIKVRKDNSIPNKDTDSEDNYVTVSLIDFLERIQALESNSEPGTGSGSGTGGLTQSQVQSIVDEEIAKVVANAPAGYDTLKEIADWIGNNPDGASAMNTAIQVNATKIAENTEAIATALTEAKEYTDEKAVDSVGATVDGQELTVEIKDKAGKVIATTTVTLPSGGGAELATGGSASPTTTAGLMRVKSYSNSGLFISASKYLVVQKASQAEIDARNSSDYFDEEPSGASHCKSIVPANLDYAVKAVLTNSKLEWTDEDKSKARALLGIE